MPTPVLIGNQYGDTGGLPSYTLRPQSVYPNADCSAGDLLIALWTDGYGNGEYLNSVTDTQGNSWNVDFTHDDIDGDGQVFIASSVLAHDLVAGPDYIELHWGDGEPSYTQVLFVLVPDFGAVDVVGTPHGAYDYGPFQPTMDANAGDFVLGVATSQNGVFYDAPFSTPAEGFTELAHNVENVHGNQFTTIVYAIPGSSGTYAPYFTSVGGYSAGQVLGYAPAGPPPPTVPAEYVPPAQFARFGMV